MTPAARIASAIELLEHILNSWNAGQRMAADRLIDQYFKARRYIGSKDRGAVAESVYWALRHKAALEWWCDKFRKPRSARAFVLASLLLREQANPTQLAPLFDGSKYAPGPLTDNEWKFAHHLAGQKLIHPDMPAHVRLNYPQWLEPQLKESLGRHMEAEMKAMQEQASVDLRTNTLLITRDELVAKLNEEGFDASPTPISPVGIRLKKREAVFASPLFRQGLFEMQDEGSQVVALLADAEPGMRVIDFCAGAGGKTLALAAMMKNKGRVLAWDTSAKRLAQLPLRLRRAQVTNTEWRALSTEHDAHIKRHKNTADRVLVDAPCSGSGTWRRNPDLKWRFTEADLKEVMAAQAHILESATRLVKTGGRLIYATCSLLKCENEKQIENLLIAHPHFRVVSAKKIWNKISTSPQGASENSENDASYLWLTPHQDGVDGFFAAVLERT